MFEIFNTVLLTASVLEELPVQIHYGHSDTDLFPFRYRSIVRVKAHALIIL